MFRCDQKSSSVVPLRAIQRYPTAESIYSRVIEYRDTAVSHCGI